MSCDFRITREEKRYLRELASRYMEYAGLPVMDERKSLWYRHNALKGERPVIVMEMDTFERDMLPEPVCSSPAAKSIEKTLVRHITNFEMINDDKVIPPYYPVEWQISIKPFGMDIVKDRAADSEGRTIGYRLHYPVRDLKKDMHLIGPSVYSVDREHTMDWMAFVEETLAGIMHAKITNSSLDWHVAPSSKAVTLLGLESMMYSIVDYPDEMHLLMKFIKEDIMAFVKWQEREGLLTLNNGNDYAGAGSYGFSEELPGSECAKTGMVRTKDLWVNMNSQETLGISPETFGEFIYPYYYDIAKEFGLVYFGCCEPVHGIWENYISRLPGLRKVSVSPWCDENYMGMVLKGGRVIYSRKPSPNFVGVGSVFDESGFEEHILNTLKAAGGCHLEIIFRDIYSLSGDRTKPRRAVEITRKLIDKYWQ